MEHNPDLWQGLAKKLMEKLGMSEKQPYFTWPKKKKPKQQSVTKYINSFRVAPEAHAKRQAIIDQMKKELGVT